MLAAKLTLVEMRIGTYHMLTSNPSPFCEATWSPQLRKRSFIVLTSRSDSLSSRSNVIRAINIASLTMRSLLQGIVPIHLCLAVYSHGISPTPSVTEEPRIQMCPDQQISFEDIGL